MANFKGDLEVYSFDFYLYGCPDGAAVRCRDFEMKGKNMEKYIEADLEIIMFGTWDVIATSCGEHCDAYCDDCWCESGYCPEDCGEITCGDYCFDCGYDCED